MLNADFVVVGAGLTGATIARTLSDAGREVIVRENRPHPGGNVRDELHESGILYNVYGPHYFRTGSQRIWDFVRRFAAFRSYEASLLTFCDERFWPWPLQRRHLEQLVGQEWALRLNATPHNFEEAALCLMPELIYRKFVKGYTEKQWGVAADKLEASLVSRFDVREDGDLRLSKHPFQGVPAGGYTAWVDNMLSGIPLVLNYDYLLHRHDVAAKRQLIFTGPIDQFFCHSLGRLKYRGQHRSHRFVADAELSLPGVQVNYPSQDMTAKIRSIEWKHINPAPLVRGTLVTDETPFSPCNPDEYEYPFPDASNRSLYEAYKQMAATIERTLFCGRLGEYRYYDMDQAIGRAMQIAATLL